MNKEKKKIMHVSRYAYPHIGGIEAVISQINRSLPDEDYEKEVLCCSNSDESSIDDGVKYSRCKYLFEFAANTISPEFIWKLSRVDTDIIHYHMPFIFAVIAHFIARPKYKKMYITYHSDIIGYDKIMKPFWGIYKKFLEQADKIHVLSPNIIESSQMIKPYKDKCVVIPQGISVENIFDNEKVQKVKKQYSNKKILFSLGRLVKYKGFIYGIEAMKNVEDAVYLIGGSGPLAEEFEKYIKENNLSEKVIMLGRISDEDVALYYQACDIYLLPSVMQSEAFGIVQLEAMRCGKPVINTNLGTGVNYVSINNETGLTVEPAKSDELSNAINILLKDDLLRKKLGQNARKRVEALFDIDKIEAQYMNLCKVNNTCLK